MSRAVNRFLCLLLLSGLLLAAGPAGAADSPAPRLGVVLLHGKHGAPDRFVDILASRLRDAGFLVAVPEMPWSKRRAYNAGFLEALAETDKAAAELRAKGAASLVVAGHSLGANAALAYAARYPGVAGIVCLAAAHSPEYGRLREESAPGVAKAKELVAQGRGGENGRYPDLNMGKSFELSATASVYLSYFDPEGPAAMPLSAAMLKTPLPILWIVGERDQLKRGPEYVYGQTPAHPASRYASVEADHVGVPSAAAQMVIEWLKALPR